MKNDSKNKTALMKATDLLALQEQSSKVLKRKLAARKYEEEEIDAAIDKLKKHNYINDEETCRRQFENFYSAGKLSVRQICVKLIQRGFDSDFVKKLVPDDTDEHEFKAADLALEKKFRREKFGGDSREKIKLKNKMWSHLSGKGFDTEIINSVVEKFLSDFERD